MDNQYSYYTPDQDNMNYGDRHGRKRNKKIPTVIKVIGLGVIFGIVASAAFQTSNIIAGKLLKTAPKVAEQKTETVGNTQLTTGSGKAVTSDISAIAKNAMPSVVSITNMSVKQVQNFFGGIHEQESESAGSGIIIAQNDTELLILTNNHVVEGNDTLTVSFIDEESVTANIKGTDSVRDLAVIAVQMKDIKESTKGKIAVAQMGDSTQLQVGEQVIAIGNALGYGQSVTTGIVSATQRTLDGFDSELIQTDAAINPGNSGGALLNMDGQLVGINSAKYSDTNVEGMGYAIPVDDVVGIIEGLMNRTIREEKVPEEKQGFLGITGQDVTLEVSEAYDMPRGIYITSVEEGSAAEKAGLKKGNIIAKFDGASVSSMGELKEQLSYYKEGEEVTFAVWAVENGQYEERTVNVVLGKRN